MHEDRIFTRIASRGARNAGAVLPFERLTSTLRLTVEGGVG